jgi:hypothetical protein
VEHANRGPTGLAAAATIRALADIKLTCAPLISAGGRLVHVTERASFRLFSASGMTKTDAHEALPTLWKQ